jgi:hypothetical protein
VGVRGSGGGSGLLRPVRAGTAGFRGREFLI